MRGIGFDVGIGMRDDLWRDGDARQMVVGTGMRDKLLSGWGCATT
jgi:hypothetical protein